MPVSAEQWRASVGSYNAAGSRALRKSLNKKLVCENPLGQILSSFVILFTGVLMTCSKSKGAEAFKYGIHLLFFISV